MKLIIDIDDNEYTEIIMSAKIFKNKDMIVPHLYEVIESGTPQQKIGGWIDDADKIDAKFGRHAYKCPKCGKYANYFVGGTEVWWDVIKPDFCPNCGMKGEAE